MEESEKQVRSSQGGKMSIQIISRNPYDAAQVHHCSICAKLIVTTWYQALDHSTLSLIVLCTLCWTRRPAPARQPFAYGKPPYRIRH